jgi:hypothetical protein
MAGAGRDDGHGWPHREEQAACAEETDDERAKREHARESCNRAARSLLARSPG